MSDEILTEHPTEKCPECDVPLVVCGDLGAYVSGNINALTFCCPEGCGHWISYQDNL